MLRFIYWQIEEGEEFMNEEFMNEELNQELNEQNDIEADIYPELLEIIDIQLFYFLFCITILVFFGYQYILSNSNISYNNISYNNNGQTYKILFNITEYILN